MRAARLRVAARPLRHLLLAPPLLFLVAFFAFPLAQTLRAAAAPAAWAWVGSDYVTERVQVAFVQAALSVLLTLALAVPLAWHHHRRALPWGRFHLALHAAPFVLPVFVVAFGVRDLLGPRGPVHALTGLDLMAALGPLGAVVVAHAYYNYGFAARILHAALERRPHRLEAAARVLGASPAAAFVRVGLPALWPSIAGVALLVFLFTFTSFGTVLLLGGSQVATLETLLYRQLGGIYPRLDRAAVLGVLQLAINVLLLLGYLALGRRTANLPRDPERAPRPARRRDVAVQWAVLVLALAPAATVLANGFRVRGEWTLEPWRALLDPGHPAHLAGFSLWEVLDRTLFYALWTAGLALALTLLLAYGLDGLGRWPRRAVELATALPLGTSSLLIGFGYVLAFGAGAALDLRGTLLVIVLVHTLVAFPFAARILLPAFQARDRRLDEAAALLGAPPRAVVRRVHWPQLRGPVAVAAGLAAAVSLGDFGASLLLMRHENLALGVWVYRHDDAFRPLRQAMATALAGLLMALAAGLYLAIERFRRRGEADL